MFVSLRRLRRKPAESLVQEYSRMTKILLVEKTRYTQLSATGQALFIWEASDSFEAAIARVLKELETLLRKHKDRMYKH